MKKIYRSFFAKLVVFVICCLALYIGADRLMFFGYNYEGAEEYTDSHEYRTYMTGAMYTIDTALKADSYKHKAAVLSGIDNDKIKYYIKYSQYDTEEAEAGKASAEAVTYTANESAEASEDNTGSDNKTAVVAIPYTAKEEELTNFSSDPDDYSVFESYYIKEEGEEPYRTGEFSRQPEDLLEPPDMYTVYIAADRTGFGAEEADWLERMGETRSCITVMPFLLLILLAGLVYMTAVAGRKNGCDGIRLLPVDSIYAEVILLALFFILFLGAFITSAVIQVGPEDMGLRTYCVEAVVIPVFACSLFLYLSVVRRLKAKALAKSLLSLRIIKRLWGFIKRLFCGLGNLIGAVSQRRLGRAAVIAFVLYNLLAVGCFFLGLASESGILFFISFGALVILYFKIILNCAGDIDKIIKGVEEIKNGNTAYRISGIKSKCFGSMAEDINNIGEGVSASFEKALRSERMKTELITNVSHDLKTPLTSIINFSKLLCEEEVSPEDAKSYAEIIYKKSKRLQGLTSDLFDISKVQSGNEVMNKKDIDLCVLTGQTLAEYDEAISSSGLEFITDMPKEGITVNADGKKMSRVLANLVENSLKYSLKNTRVYITVKTDEKATLFEIKNISAEKPDFDTEEITERFVRGDSSRSTEGSGLGLAIAKSYTEANGGSFRITTDGDLFKATVIFPKA